MEGGQKEEEQEEVHLRVYVVPRFKHRRRARKEMSRLRESLSGNSQWTDGTGGQQVTERQGEVAVTEQQEEKPEQSQQGQEGKERTPHAPNNQAKRQWRGDGKQAGGASFGTPHSPWEKGFAVKSCLIMHEDAVSHACRSFLAQANRVETDPTVYADLVAGGYWSLEQLDAVSILVLSFSAVCFFPFVLLCHPAHPVSRFRRCSRYCCRTRSVGPSQGWRESLLEAPRQTNHPSDRDPTLRLEDGLHSYSTHSLHSLSPNSHANGDVYWTPQEGEAPDEFLFDSATVEVPVGEL
eukprot:gb/GEZN01009514.1/.p1 GENE.gb/GEZN01009514.1/~~gb/GEZN01009514.1/.p1  ORF type:complete len:294 (+),score=55.19 gb/GEZN01009514.1/:262-1143(+)